MRSSTTLFWGKKLWQGGRTGLVSGHVTTALVSGHHGQTQSHSCLSAQQQASEAAPLLQAGLFVCCVVWQNSTAAACRPAFRRMQSRPAVSGIGPMLHVEDCGVITWYIMILHS
jgi:hypothetical protein